MTSDTLALLALPVYTVLCALCSLSWELGPAAANGGACAWQEGQPGAAGAAQLPTPSLSVQWPQSCLCSVRVGTFTRKSRSELFKAHTQC